MQGTSQAFEEITVDLYAACVKKFAKLSAEVQTLRDKTKALVYAKVCLMTSCILLIYYTLTARRRDYALFSEDICPGLHTLQTLQKTLKSTR